MTWNDTQGETLSHKCDVRHCASTDGARRAQNCALYRSVCFVVSVPLFAMWFRLFMSICRSQMFVNMRCRVHSLYKFWSLELGAVIDMVKSQKGRERKDPKRAKCQKVKKLYLFKGTGPKRLKCHQGQNCTCSKLHNNWLPRSIGHRRRRLT